MAVPPDPSSVRTTNGAWRHSDVRANGLRFHVVEAESDVDMSDRPLVLLLHGFAEFWWSWRHQLVALQEQGFRAVAVDLRGYGDTDKPPRGYDGWTLAGDTNGLVRALGHRSATLVGHADGGLVCWATATLHPRVVSRIAVIASPHPRELRRHVLRDSEQRSAFLTGFIHNQLPRIGERRLTRSDGEFVEDYFRSRSASSWQDTDDFAETVAVNRSAIQIPSVAHCSLEYRRWAFRSQFRPDGMKFMDLMDRRLQIPVLALRGADDRYILEPAMAASTKWAADLRQVQVAGTGHFAHQESPTAVTEQLVELLGA